MAALFIAGAIALQEKLERKKEAKRIKKLNDDDRYEELQKDTRKRLARTQSGNVLERPPSRTGSLRNSEDAGPPPPAYHEVVAQGAGAERST